MATEQSCAHEVIGTWVAPSCEDEAASIVKETLSDAGIRSTDATLGGARPADANAIRGLALQLSHQRTVYHVKKMN